MWAADEINDQRIGALHGHNKQSGRSGLGLNNFMQTNIHMSTLIYVDIKTIKTSPLFDIRLFSYCLDQEILHYST